MSGPNKSQDRKDRIIEVATRVFAEKGFHETTVAEIAQAAKVAEATIYEYFSTKEGLLFAIPLETTRRLNEYSAFHLKLMSGAVNRLRAIVYLYLDLYENHPDYAAVCLLILKPNVRFRQTEAYQLIRQGFRGTTAIIKEGITSGELRPDLDPYAIRSVVMGAVDHVTTNWLMSGRRGRLIDLVDSIVTTVMEGILPPPAAQEAGAARPKWNDWKGAGAPSWPGKTALD